MNPEWILQIFLVVFLIILIPITHELGHLIYAKEMLNKKVKLIANWKKFRFYTQWEDDGKITKKEESNIAFFGILAGFIPFVIVMEYISLYFVIPLLLTYMTFSCRHDWKDMWRLKN